MKVSYTTHRSKLGLLPPDDYKKPLFDLYEKSEDHHGGYVTITIELPKQPGSDEQNRTFHALLNAFWLTGCASFQTFETMRDEYKLRAGGPKEWKVLTETAIVTAKDIDGYEGYRSVPIPKSWTEFTKRERSEAIELVLADIMSSGASSKKLDEIIQGMEADNG